MPFVGAVLVVVLAIRLAYLGTPLRPDEAGYLIVGRDWHLGGPNLYGHYWVDRPPGVIGLFKLASLLPWDFGIRLVALPFVALFVCSAAWAGNQVGGRTGARWAAVIGAALMVTPSLWAHEADGELFAAPWVMTSVALTLAAVRAERRRSRGVVGYGVAAGVTAGLAVMTKQNFVDGFVFATALVVGLLVTRRMRRGQGARLLLAGVAGGLVVLLAAMGYAAMSGAGVGALFFDLFGFRSAAFDVISDGDLATPLSRAAGLLLIALVTGVLVAVLVLAGRGTRWRRSAAPLGWAVAVTVLTGVVGIALGGSYWPHYLLQLAPMVSLGMGAWAAHSRPLRLAGLWVVVSALVSSTVFVGTAVTAGERSAGADVGAWVAASSRPGDTLTVLYGHAEVQQAAGLDSPYEHLWSLPLRTLDPHERELRRLLAGPSAPTWLVLWGGDLNAWHIDQRGLLQLTVDNHYQQVATLCDGHQVWLHDGTHRTLAPKPPSCQKPPSL